VKQDATPAIAAVDWGTSHLRIWLLDAAGGVLAERRGDEGLLATAPQEFPGVLERHLEAMGAPDNLPAMICGMAGARQGWIEAPYVAAPAALLDILGHAVRAPGSIRKVCIVPGVAQRLPDAPDVMRGEETQLAGAAELLAEGPHLVCMPGTHCKWVDVEDGAITGFGTWLTGELFSLLSKQSILRHAVGGASANVDPGNPVFRSWLEKALAQPADMTSRLFTIRASTLLFELQPQDAAAALSGLLIGTEIASAGARFGRLRGEIVLIASGTLRTLYAGALAAAGYLVRSIDAEAAVRAGLWEAARRNLLKDAPRSVRA
jgi:2-dehydro-3-deoxygalactonokinase